MTTNKKPHAQPSYDQDLNQVRQLVAAMATRSRDMLAGSLEALARRDAARAKEIATQDRAVNRLEVDIDERCLHLLARWQPAAADLRFIAATLKLVTDLERIGDEAVNICERVVDLQHEPMLEPPVDLTALGTAVREVVADALAALEQEDVQAAGQVIERSQRIDALVREILRGCFHAFQGDPRSVQVAMRVHEIAGHLQRIAAHAVNIAEMVIFLVRGQDVRHAGRLPSTIPASE